MSSEPRCLPQAIKNQLIMTLNLVDSLFCSSSGYSKTFSHWVQFKLNNTLVSDKNFSAWSQSNIYDRKPALQCTFNFVIFIKNLTTQNLQTCSWRIASKVIYLTYHERKGETLVSWKIVLLVMRKKLLFSRWVVFKMSNLVSRTLLKTFKKQKEQCSDTLP